MNIFVMNTNFEVVSVLDSYESIIWNDRYASYGDVEIYTNFDPKLLDVFKQDYYLSILESEHMMIIEGLEITSDSEEGNHLKITGRSLESILDRRIVWAQTSVSGSLQTALKNLMNAAIINPSIADRKISNFIFQDSTDTAITSLTLTAQFTGDNLYTIVTEVCEAYKIGFKIVLNDSNQFVFSLYSGTDRSYSQEANPYVVFSPKYENVINSDYINSSETMKNVTLVAGEGEGDQRITVTVGSGSGLTRRELFTDARDIQSREVSDINAALIQRGREALADNTSTVHFEGQVEATKMFKYREDFWMGDIVQIANEYGIEGAARVISFIHSEDTNGIQLYPTFEAIQDVIE